MVGSLNTAQQLILQYGTLAAPPPPKEKPPTQAEQLLSLADAAQYVHTPDGKPYAIVRVDGDGPDEHTETLALRSRAFRSWLAHEYYRASNKKATSAKVMEDVQRVLEARATFEGATCDVHLRVARNAPAVYLDVADSLWRSVAVDAQGWSIATEGAPLFRRSRGMLALPVPEHGGTLEQELRPFLNIDDDGWRLLVPWMVQALLPRGPYPVLNLNGEQGAAKSTTARVIRANIDPSAAPLRSQPRDEHDLVIAASNSWVVALDNLSHIELWLSDALCRLSTGGGFGTRELYTNDEEVIFDAQRPVILTGIEDLATRGDLLDRSVLVRLPSIPDDQRRTEAEFWQGFEEARPRILGALLDTLSGALRELPGVELPGRPRMADFALLGIAVERALGWPEGAFLDAYKVNRADATLAALESSVIFPALSQFAATLPGGTWDGACMDLLERLTRIAGDKARSKYWPASPRALSGQLRRLAPALRDNGVRVEFRKVNGERLVSVRRAGRDRDGTGTVGTVGDGRDGRDGSPPTVSPLAQPDTKTLFPG
jgi:hypothetical protein